MASVESVPAYLQPGVSVSQPPHLEGDPSLATEILPGPPPLASIHQAGLPRKDHKKASVTFSYLPAADPGTTYTTHFLSSIAAAPADMDGSRRKRTRLDKGIESSRSQRASARTLAVVVSPPEPIVLPEATASSSHALSDFDPQLLPHDSDDAMVSRATSLHAEDSPPGSVEPAKRHRRTQKDKGKGKGKERERDLGVRVKEEPGVVSLGNEVTASLSNEDHCSACRSLGALVYCDGCTKAFHWLCLDPPMDATDLPEGESRWFCPACVLEQRPPPKPSASLKFMAPLVSELGTKIPTEFQLPQDIRLFFKDVGTGPKGTYQDTSEVKQPRFNRHGQLEDRDPYRLKDRNGESVLCFRCGTSALPPGVAADAPATKRARRSISIQVNNHEAGRAIISCDYCHLHFHLDCLDPPMILMPPWSKKWMCPNHAEQVLQPKHRIPRTNATPIDITKPRQWNNGNIEIIQADSAPPPAIVPEKLNAEEVLINGRRYRVPERIITLDFWGKITKNRRGDSASDTGDVDESSALSSPLTSLSSLDDQESVTPFSMGPALYTLDDVNFAQMLCGLRLQSTSGSSTGGEEHPHASVNGTHGESTHPGKRVKIEDDTPKAIVEKFHKATTAVATASSASAEPSRPRRAAASRTAPTRSRSTRKSGRSADDEVPMDIDFEPPELVISSGKRPDARRKAARPTEKAPQTTVLSLNGTKGTSSEGDTTPGTSDVTETGPAKGKRRRQSMRLLSPVRTSSRAKAIKPDPDQDVDQQSKSGAKAASSASTARKKKANGTTDTTTTTTRIPHKPVTPPMANGKASAPAPEPKTEATPTLKIRLPRLGAFSSPSTGGPSTASEASKASPTKATSTSSRPRRSLRRQMSIPTSMNTTSISDVGSSSRVNDNGLSSSPIESF